MDATDHHTVAAHSLVTGVISHVSSKHTTPRAATPKTASSDDAGNASGGEEEEKAGNALLDDEAERLLDAAMEERGYDVTDKEVKSSTSSPRADDEDDGLDALLSKQQHEIEGETNVGTQPQIDMSPTKLEVMSMMYEQIDEHIGDWEEAKDDTKNIINNEDMVMGTSVTEIGNAEAQHAGDIEFDDEDSVDELPSAVDPPIIHDDEGRRHDSKSPVLVDGESTHEEIKAKEMERWNAVREEEERRRREVEEINLVLTEKEQLRNEESLRVKSVAKERQMKLRADARARRAQEIAARRQLENMRIGVDTRVASPPLSELSVAGSSPAPFKTRGQLSPSSSSSPKQKSPLQEQLAMQLEQIQMEREMEKIARSSELQADEALSGAGIVGTRATGGGDGSRSRSPEREKPFQLSEGRGKNPRSEIVEAEEGFYLDSKGQLRETDTGRVKGKGPGGSSPSIPTRDNQPRLGGAVAGKEDWDHRGGTFKKKSRAKYPFSEARLERRRMEVEQQRQQLAQQAVEKGAMREEWEPSTDYVAVEGDDDADDADRHREDAEGAPYDDNVTNRYLPVSPHPYQPTLSPRPTTPDGVQPSSKPGGRAARLPLQKKKAAAAAAGAGRERFRNDLLSPERDQALFAEDPELNAVIADIVASRSPSPSKAKYGAARAEQEKKRKKKGSPSPLVKGDEGSLLSSTLLRPAEGGAKEETMPEYVSDVEAEVGSEFSGIPQPHALKHTSPKLPALSSAVRMNAPDRYDNNGHLIPGESLLGGSMNNPGGNNSIPGRGDGRGDKTMKPRDKKPLYMRMQEKAQRRQEEEELKRQEDYIEYRLKRAEAQPTREEIEEHRRLHDEGILRLRLMKVSDTRRKIVGGVNYDNDDLVAAQNVDAPLQDHGEDAEGERERAAAFKSVFKARDGARKKPSRDWKYLDEIGSSSSNTTTGGGGAVHVTRGKEGADYNNKYHQMAVKEARMKKKGRTLADAELQRNQERKKRLSDNVRETFLPAASPPPPLSGRKGRVGFDYDHNYSYDSPSSQARMGRGGAGGGSNYQASLSGRLSFDQERVERLYAARGDGSLQSPSRLQTDTSDPYDRGMDLLLTLSPRSSKFGQEYINEVLDRDDTEKQLVRMYKGGFDKYFHKGKSESSPRKRPPATSNKNSGGGGGGDTNNADDGGAGGSYDVYRAHTSLSLLKNKKKREYRGT